MFIKIKDCYIYNVTTLIKISPFLCQEILVIYGTNQSDRILFNSMEERDAEFRRIWDILSKGA